MSRYFILLTVIAWVLYDRYKAGCDMRLTYVYACLAACMSALLPTALAGYALARLPLDWNDLFWGDFIWVVGLPLVFALSCRFSLRLFGRLLVRLRRITTEQYDAVFLRKKGAEYRQTPRYAASWILAFPLALTLYSVADPVLFGENPGPVLQLPFTSFWADFAAALFNLFVTLTPFIVAFPALVGLFDRCFAWIGAKRG